MIGMNMTEEARQWWRTVADEVVDPYMRKLFHYTIEGGHGGW